VRLTLAPIALAAAVACGPPASRGVALYQEHRYVEAAEAFERTEGRLEESGARVCAEYGLYRGLTYLRLDDLEGARRWLDYAAEVERGNPGALGSDDARRLDAARAEVGRRRTGDAGSQAPAEARQAAARAEPPSNGRRTVGTPY